MRVKIKSSKYLLLSLYNPLMNNNIINDKSLLELIVKNEHATFVEYCPEWRQAVESILSRLERVRKYIFDKIDQYGSEIPDREFAIKVSKE